MIISRFRPLSLWHPLIALTLPEDDESKIREKVFDQIKLDDLKKDTGFDTLLEFLDKHLDKDDLADSLEKH